MNCYVCDNEITSDNSTDEHIIINAAGGRLKSKKLICHECHHSKYWEKIDTFLAKQLNALSNMLMVKRHRGKPQPIIGHKKSTGEKYLLKVGGKPVLNEPNVEKTVDEDRTNISITARSEKELRQILKGIAKKNPQFDVEEAMKSAKWREEYFDEALHFQNEIGGTEVFRAVCKCATNFFVYKNGDSSQIKPLIPYIKGKVQKEVVGMHYQENVYELAPDESFHLIHLVGKPDDKTLYCYVDYFNTYKYLILLSDNYTGKEMKETYCFDLINIEEKVKEISLDYDRDTLLNFFKNKDAKPFEKVKKSFNHSIALGLKRQDDFQRGELLERAIQNSLGRYPEGTKITKKM
ncbi:MAG: HNH endonuclease, partial [Candidatus Paceibacterota bacterium]